MRKLKIVIILALVVAIAVPMFSLAGCKAPAAAETTAAAAETTEAVKLNGTPINEPKMPVPDNVIGAGNYDGEFSYKFFRDQALTGKFDEDYAKDYKLAVTNLAASVPICTQIVNSIQKYWELAGGKKDNTLVLDNAFDVNTTIKNGDAVLAWKPDVFVEYGMDEKTNQMISKKAQEQKTWVLGLDVTFENYPFMGGDNWANGTISGDFAIKYINEKFGGIENVDRVYYCWNPEFGEVVSYRMWGARKVMVDTFGNDVDFLVDGSKAVQVKVTNDFQSPWLDILAKYPNDKNIVVFAPYEAAAAGMYAAAKTLGRWDADAILLNSLGGDDLGRPLIRSGITDSTVGWVPETYGTYVIPLALAHMYGNPIPAVTYLQHALLTKDTIEQFYPGETSLYTEDTAQ
ncbi:MAG: sugar ABC transporter substrate-binding protein [Candidatus Humimicrobiaceae bacterium]